MDSEERREAVRRELERRRETLRAASTRPRVLSCRNCDHGPTTGRHRGFCTHPLSLTIEIKGRDTVEAKAWKRTEFVRSEAGLCGPEAYLYEQRSFLRRAWLSLKGWKYN